MISRNLSVSDSSLAGMVYFECAFFLSGCLIPASRRPEVSLRRWFLWVPFWQIWAVALTALSHRSARFVPRWSCRKWPQVALSLVKPAFALFEFLYPTLLCEWYPHQLLSHFSI
ncbi:hypothetical protein GALMADRAFT_399464 [Galerina marginata CBS 339.88]|uniref:Uncharacterized protein n=1 Tax=Galerina marginata (strain CBS 339.88) TaxID=685588 RepID=A0A067TS49_GALM3|nr:hypothetical protein GALMADRAFT_399464 [Galerina marginata CBS 339.88]